MNEGTAVGFGTLWIPLILMLVAMYFLIWRPVRNSLKKGDQITTIGGIIGKIVQVQDESIIIETSEDRVRMELAKWAVSNNNSQQPADKKGKKAKDGGEDLKIEDGSGSGDK